VGKIAAALIVPLIAVLMVPLFQYSTAPAVFPPKQGIPFVGMSLVYFGNNRGDTEIRTVAVLKYNSTTNCVTVRDSQDLLDSMEVDVGTREVKWCSGTWQSLYPTLWPIYVEYWIPTNIELGSHVRILMYDAVVIESTELSVCGKTISVWQLQAYYGPGHQDTWYYEKKTGLWVGAAWILYDADGRVIANWGGHLVSTNVALR